MPDSSAAMGPLRPGASRPTGNVPLSGVLSNIAIAKTIKPSDTDTSIVIDPAGPQIQYGKTGITTHTNVVYSTPKTNGKISQLEMDIQVPSTLGSKPAVVFITGGAFVLANKSASLDQRSYIADQGYVVASITYRTVLARATWRDAVADVKSAIRFLRAHAKTYGISPETVALWGQSAGGYLAALAGATNGDSQFDIGDHLDESSDVQAVVDEFGPSDLSKIAADYDAAMQKAKNRPGNPLAKFVLGPDTELSVDDDPSEVRAANPATYISPRTPPFIELHGSGDQLVSPSQTLLLHTALRAKGIPSTRYVLQGANHGDMPLITDPRAASLWSTKTVMGIIVEFLARHLR
jgi:acetyl esterase/lipase